MREDYYSDYFEFEQNNWWFVSRRRILRALLKKYLKGTHEPFQILDAGCGTGINLSLLTEFGDVVGVDKSEEAIRFCHSRNEKSVKQACLQNLPFPDGYFDLITALDVLEHIEEDGAALQEIGRVCKQGGFVLITVPVFPFLWGEHDEINQHVRRYQPSRLLSMLNEHHLNLIHRSYMNTWLLPMAFGWRWWRQIRRWMLKPENHLARADNMHHHPFLNSLLTAIFSSELPLVLTTGLPIGLSLVVLARKK